MKKNNLFSGLAVFVITFVVYALTCAPGVYFTDSGELAGAVATLGVSHPSGYPLFVLLGKLWTILPLAGTIIRELNLFAAFCTAASAFVFVQVAALIMEFSLEFKSTKEKKKSVAKADDQAETVASTKSHIGAAVLGLCYAFGATVWAQATSIEVYSLHLLMINLVLLSFLSGIIKNNNKNLMVSALLLGLSFTNHMTTILLLPAMIFLFFKRPGEKFNFGADRLKSLLFMMIPFVLGLSVYLYLPLRASAQPEFNWGYVSRGFDKLLYHMQGKQYQVWMFTGSKVWGENFDKFASAFAHQFLFFLVLPVLYVFSLWAKNKNESKYLLMTFIGMIAAPFISFKGKGKEILWFFIILGFSCIFYSFNYSIHDIDSYFLTAFIAYYLLCAVGLGYLSEKFGNKSYAMLAIPVIVLAMNFSNADLSKDNTVEEYTKLTAGKLEKNALIISAQWDFWVSPFWYMQKIENYRPDVVLVEKELLRRTWYPYQFAKWYPEIANKSRSEIDAFMKDLELFESEKPYDAMSIQTNYVNMLNSFIDKNYGSRPIYITLDVMETEPDVAKDYIKIPEGMAFRLTKDTNITQVKFNPQAYAAFIASAKGREGHLYDAIRASAAVNVFNIGRYALMTRQINPGRSAIATAQTIDPENPTINEMLYQMQGR